MFRVTTFFPLEREELVKLVEEVLSDEEIGKIARTEVKVIGLNTKAVSLDKVSLLTIPPPGRKATVTLNATERTLNFWSVEKKDFEIVREVLSMMEERNPRLVEKLKELREVLKRAEIEVRTIGSLEE